MKRWRKAVMVASILIFNPSTIILGWLGMMLWADRHPETGTNLETVDWLPPSATDVSYFKTYSRKVWEATMVEAEFRKWTSQFEMKEIDEAHSIIGVSFENSRRFRHASGEPYPHAEEQTDVTTVRNGLFAMKRGSGGGGYYIVFDRRTNRVYYQSNRR